MHHKSIRHSLFVIPLLSLILLTSAATARAQNTNGLLGDIEDIAGTLGISSNPTNYAVATGMGVKDSGDQYAAWGLIFLNVTNHVAPCIGYDHLWLGGKAGSANIVSGGVTLKTDIHPLQWLVSNTNTWAYNLRATPYVTALAGTPTSSTSIPGGGLASIVRTGAAVDLVQFSKWEIDLLADYGNRNGAGNYNGNWFDIGIAARWNIPHW